MNDIVSHLSEQHQFYIALLDKAVSLFTIVFIGTSTPNFKLFKKDTTPPTSPTNGS